MTSHVIVTVFFRLVNFTLLIIVLIYIYRKYIYNFLIEGIQQNIAFLKKLEEDTKDICSQKENLQRQLHTDQNCIVELKKKMALWIQKEHILKKNRIEQKDNYSKRLKQLSDFKQSRIAQHLLEKQSMPSIIAQAKDQLIQKYNDQRSREYTQKAIASLSPKSAPS